MAIFISGNLCEILFFLQMLVDGEIYGDIHSTNYELLAYYHAHTAGLGPTLFAV